MVVTRYDDIFAWDGWGGELKLSSGRCHLRIYDLQSSDKHDPVILKSIIVVVSDLPEAYATTGTLSIRSCAGHIATRLVRQFQIPPDRMLYIEYHPLKTYGREQTRTIQERYEAVDFKWRDEKAFPTKWRVLDAHLRDKVKGLMNNDHPIAPSG